MKTIGIIGKSGAGKTTLSKMLQRNDDISVIHLDEIVGMNEIKQKLPKRLIDTDLNTNELGESFLTLNKRMRDVRDKLIRNKIIRKIYIKMMSLPRKALFKKNINRNKKNSRVIIIERNYC